MSCNEWEAGTIKLPTDQVVAVRDAVRRAVESFSTSLYDRSQEFWKALKPSHKANVEKYRVAARAFIWGNSDDVFNQQTKRWEKRALDASLPAWPGFNDRQQIMAESLEALLSYTVLPHGAAKPRRVTQADVAKVVGKPTGAKFTVSLGEATIRFDGRNVRWDVSENNHACDRAREHPFAVALFQALDRVRWTRGSGGQIIGNNEYSRDNREAGGGGNYVVTEYGPNRPTRRPTSVRW